MTGFETARHGAVAAGHQVTADAAAEILADGGNAFDAVIAALWTACVCEPVLASPGGGGFLMARAGDRTELIDFFVESPGRKRSTETIEFCEIHADFGTATQAFHIGAGAGAVPGFVAGLFATHERLATMPMRRLVEPALDAARGGVTITDFQAFLFDVVSPILTWTPEARARFAPKGALFKAGETYRNPDLAAAIEILARDGPRQITEGEIGRAMLDGQAEGGHLSTADFQRYQVAIREPILRTIDRTKIALNPLPALGGGLIAAMLDRIDPGRPVDTPAIAAAIHAVDRAWRAAPDKVDQLAGLAPGAETGPPATRGTTQVSVIDADGNGAAATVSNGEGNGRIVPGCGFMLNNMLGEEDVNPAGFHNWKPATRLGSMMAPTVCMAPDGGLLTLGSGGSNRIRTAIFQVLANRLANGQPITEAIAAPRLHIERERLDFEDFLTDESRQLVTEYLPDYRSWPEPNLYFGGVHAVEYRPGHGFAGGGDFRRAGVYRTA